MERAHRHASELTKSSIDIDGDVEVIAAATDHLQVKLQCPPRDRCAESSKLSAKWAHACERRRGWETASNTHRIVVSVMGHTAHSQTDGRERPLDRNTDLDRINREMLQKSRSGPPRRGPSLVLNLKHSLCEKRVDLNPGRP